MSCNRPLRQRFEEKYVVDHETGCWLWTARIDPAGYARFQRGRGVSPMAHRYAYELHVGPIPDGYTIDHLCRVRHCVNPAHLEAVTHVENVRRGEGPTATNGRKTHCKRGHAFTPENTILTTKGNRHCRECKNAAHRAYKKRHPEKNREQFRRWYEKQKAAA